jgi:ABC-2 type transport system permease protein
MLLGGVLLPMETAPRWLYIASRINPLTYLVEAERALFTGELAATSVLYGTIVACGIGALGLWVGTRTIARATV